MKLKPFKAIRPRKTLVSQVSSLPYDVYSEAEAREIVKQNPRSFLTVVRPETVFPEGVDPSGEEVYLKACELIDENIAEGNYKEDPESYYVYRLVMNGRAQTGLVACFSVDDYLESRIKKHELTRADKEDDRTRHIDICNAQTGLIFLTFGEGDEARKILREAVKEEPLYDFVSIDNVGQSVWKIDDPEKVETITKAFSRISALYIADGHHRTASAAAVCQMRREDNPGYTGEEEFNYFMAVAFPCEELLVMPYYRVVSDLNGLSSEEFLSELEKKFTIEKKPLGALYEPARQGEIAMFLDDVWYKLVARAEILKEDAIGSLDVTMLQDNVLGPILGIGDIRTDKRIDFIGGIRGTAELEKRCREDMKVAFALHHTTVEQMIRIADEGQIMPPKSTWFEPKLQSGMFIHRI